MKIKFMKIKLLLILLASASLIAVSCDKDKSAVKYGDQMFLLEYETENVKGALKSAGYFYDEEDKGYNIVFLSENKAPDHRIEVEPKGPWFTIDLPEDKTNGTYDLKESLDSEEWAFYSYADGGYYFDNGRFKDGTIKIALNRDAGTIDFKMDATYNDNTRISVRYKGKMAKSDDYIKNW